MNLTRTTFRLCQTFTSTGCHFHNCRYYRASNLSPWKLLNGHQTYALTCWALKSDHFSSVNQAPNTCPTRNIHTTVCQRQEHDSYYDGETDGGGDAVSSVDFDMGVNNDFDTDPFDDKTVGYTFEEQKALMEKKPVMPKNSRTLRVGVIGCPNAGKSTLANKLMGWRFSSVSSKVHTTRRKALGVLTEGNAQVVFLDTPGMIQPSKVRKLKLERLFLTDPHSVLYEADLILVVVDATNSFSTKALHIEILKTLYLHRDKPSVLVINKVDLLKSRKSLLHMVRILTNGEVQGGKNWRTIKPKRDKKLDEDELFDRVEALRAKQKCVASVDLGEHMADTVSFSSADMETDEEDMETEEPAKAEAERLTNSKGKAKTEKLIVDQYTAYERPKDTSKTGGYDFEDLRDWSQYYAGLRKIEDELGEKAAGWGHFSEVFMLSALDGRGIWDLKKYLLDSTRPGPWQYHSSLVTDQHPLEMARMCVWEKLLDNLPGDVPYNIRVHIARWEEDDQGLLRIQIDLHCKTTRATAMLIGEHHSMIKKITQEARQELMNTFRREMTLRMRAVEKKEWKKNRPRQPKGKESGMEEDEDDYE